jgi:flagellar biosynthetic protein FliR
MVISSAQLVAWIGAVFWPFVRIGAMLMVAPLFGTRVVPPRVRVALALLLAWIVAPLLPPAPAVEPLSITAALITLQQLLIGAAMGFALQMVFGALVLGSQSLAMSTGLGFASMVDPLNGVHVPVVGQHYLMLASLIFLALDGHLVLIQVLVDSFQTLPLGTTGLSRASLWALLGWAGRMFAGGVMLALPAMISMLLLNLAIGIVSKAAPQLNLFAVGFPVMLLTGLMVIMLSLPGLQPQLAALLLDAFDLMRLLAGG